MSDSFSFWFGFVVEFSYGNFAIQVLLLRCDVGASRATTCTYVGRTSKILEALHEGSLTVGSKRASPQTEVLWSPAVKQAHWPGETAGDELVYIGAGLEGWSSGPFDPPRGFSSREEEPSECRGDLPAVLQFPKEYRRVYRELLGTGDAGA